MSLILPVYFSGGIYSKKGTCGGVYMLPFIPWSIFIVNYEISLDVVTGLCFLSESFS